MLCRNLTNFKLPSGKQPKFCIFEEQVFSLQVCLALNMTARFFHSANKSPTEKKSIYGLSLWFLARKVKNTTDITPKLSILHVTVPVMTVRKFHIQCNVANGAKRYHAGF